MGRRRDRAPGPHRSGRRPATTDAEKKQYKARRDEERRVRRELYKRAWQAYKRVARRPPRSRRVLARHRRRRSVRRRRSREASAQDNALPDARRCRRVREGARPHDPAAALARVSPRGRHRHALPPLDWCPKRDGTPRLICAPKPELKARAALDHARGHRAPAGARRGARLPRRAARSSPTRASTPARAISSSSTSGASTRR